MYHRFNQIHSEQAESTSTISQHVCSGNDIVKSSLHSGLTSHTHTPKPDSIYDERYSTRVLECIAARLVVGSDLMLAGSRM